MIRIPTQRAPTHPGEMLLEEFLNPMGITQRELAEAIHVPYQRINEIVNGKRGLTPSTASPCCKTSWRTRRASMATTLTHTSKTYSNACQPIRQAA